MLAFPNAYGITVRYAMKSSPNAAILKLFDKMGLHFDCSSVHEVRRAMAAGVAAEKCSLSTQELTDGFEELVARNPALEQHRALFGPVASSTPRELLEPGQAAA